MVKMVKEGWQICTLNKPPYCPKDGENLTKQKFSLGGISEPGSPMLPNLDGYPNLLCIRTSYTQSHTGEHKSMMHQKYLPFTEQPLLSHFADVRQNGKYIKNVKHLEYLKQSIERYKKYLADNPVRRKKPLKEMRFPCQIEKDEKFWLAACMMTILHSQNRRQEFTKLFRNGYGEAPPIKGLNSWDECLGEKLHLFFEPNLPSPTSYEEWLRNNLTKRQFIP